MPISPRFAVMKALEARLKRKPNPCAALKLHVIKKEIISGDKSVTYFQRVREKVGTFHIHPNTPIDNSIRPNNGT